MDDAKAERNAYVRAFWNQAFAGTDAAAKRVQDTPFERCFWETLGCISGKDVLEIGCGLGDDTIRYARQGARVLSVDISEVAVARVRERLASAGLDADVRVMDAFDLDVLGRRFDLIVGKFILHHLEPFQEISRILAARLKPEGRMVFMENNASNPWLLFARKYLAGRYGIPKHGDDVEYPLTPEEVAMLRRDFGQVECKFPELIFLRKLNTYVFRHKKIFRPVTRTINRLDDALWHMAPGLRPWSYNQIVVAAGPREV
jgi:2-polyprenyl-3-methyl-5-hydroxy-6-metoxy-1,4-benzoquinol methylase